MTLQLDQQKKEEEENIPCPVCGQTGERHAIEILPDGGKLWMIMHKDGTVCRWAVHDEAVIHKRKPPQPTQIVVCPKCGEKGKANNFYASYKRPEPLRRLYIRYRVLHSKKQCHITDDKQRDDLLKQIGRFISSPLKTDPLVKNLRGRYQSSISTTDTGTTLPVTKKRGRGRPPNPEPEEIEQQIDEKYQKLMADELKNHLSSKGQLVAQYAEALHKEAKIPLDQINEHITKKLKGLVSARYVREVLPGKYKNQRMADNKRARGGKHHQHKKRKWNVEQAHKLSKKQLIAIFMATRDKWGKEFDELAEQVLTVDIK